MTRRTLVMLIAVGVLASAVKFRRSTVLHANLQGWLYPLDTSSRERQDGDQGRRSPRLVRQRRPGSICCTGH
jgi:hypothetical protein